MEKTTLTNLMLTLAMTVVIGVPVEEVNYWSRYGDKRLHDALNKKDTIGHARNVIIFIGDGMGMSTITAARIYKGQLSGKNGEEYQLVYEKFPNIGLSKTYNVDKQVPDSAGTATAMFTGVKSNYYMLGLDSNAQYEVCDDQRNKKSRLDSIMKWAQVAGKDTGVVTTTRITHATPAALYAYSNHRDWECDSEIPLKYRDCIKDIARQLVEDEPAKNFKVILGGGQKQLGIPVKPNDDDSCNRTDGRNLLHTWMEGRQNSLFVNNTRDLMNANVDELDYLMGIFSPGHMPYALERDHGPNGSPSLQNMTAQAMKMLSKSPTGFVLMVEGGRIDHAHHDNYAKLALHEASELADAVEYAVTNTNPKDTLIIVTADHSHGFTMNGYPNRGNDILGYASNSDVDNPYETLTYANGPGYYTHLVSNSSDCSANLWRVISQEERKQSRYRHFSPYYLKDETHGGEDVPVFSTGPSSYLLTGVFEQNYIAHAVGFAACMGPPAKYCEDVNIGMLVSPSSSSSTSVTAMNSLFILPLILSIGALYKR